MLITCGMCQMQAISSNPRGAEDSTLVLWVGVSMDIGITCLTDNYP